MKTSSARLAQPEFEPTDGSDAGSTRLSADPLARAERDGIDNNTLRVPDFAAHGEAFAATSRLAGRINASAVSNEEHEALLAERQLLLDNC